MTQYGETVAAIDVHKAMLAVVVATAGEQDETLWFSRKFGTRRNQLLELRTWLGEMQVTTVAMESTALYWRPVWLALEGQFRLILAQARSTTGPRGRKGDWVDARRILRRLRANDLTVSFVPDAEQRQWRLLTRSRIRYQAQIARLRNQIEGLLEEGQIKISSLLSDLLGVSGWRILQALADGDSDAEKMAGLGHAQLRATKAELTEALSATLHPPLRLLLRQALDQIDLLRRQVQAVDEAIAALLHPWQDAVTRLCQVPGVSTVAAAALVAELGPEARAFASAAKAASWAGVCPGRQESAGVSTNNRCPQGNRVLKRLLNQCAIAASRVKGCHFQQLFRRLLPRLGYQKTLGAIAHRLLVIVWKLLHHHLSYQEPEETADSRALHRRTLRHLRALKALGYQVELKLAAATPGT